MNNMTFWEEIKRPFNIVTLVLTIVSLVLSIIFYFESVREREITYLINEPSIIFDSQNSSPKIKLIEKDSIIITQNVFVLTGKIWNSGELPINNSDVRRKLNLFVKNSVRILDFKIVKQTDESIASFNLEKNDSKSLNINWKYFDPQYGFSFQIIYIGNEKPECTITGKVLDISSFKKYDKKVYIKWSIGLILAYVIIAIWIVLLIFKYRNRTGRFDKTLMSLLFITISVLLYLTYKVYISTNEIPI